MQKSSGVKILEGAEKIQIEEYLMQRFGIGAELFQDYDWIKANKAVWLASKQALNIVRPSWNIERYGLRALKGREFPYWPTTAFVQIFGKHAVRGKISLERQEAESYLALQDIKKKLDFPHGAIMVSYKENILGTALYHEESILSFYPKRLLGYFGAITVRD